VVAGVWRTSVIGSIVTTPFPCGKLGWDIEGLNNRAITQALRSAGNLPEGGREEKKRL
jgi:hypothetical protein